MGNRDITVIGPKTTLPKAFRRRRVALYARVSTDRTEQENSLAAQIDYFEKRIKDRRTLLERNEDRLMQILDRECAGQKTDCGVATVSYRATTRVDVHDGMKAINWLKRHKHTDCYRTPEPEISKTEVKKRFLVNS